MIPGLAGPPFPPRAKKGSLVAVASVEHPSVPMVVGTCEIDVSSLDSVKGAKGHAVQTAHWCGDELWAWSPSGRPGATVPAHLKGWVEDEPLDDELAQRVEHLDLDEDGEDGGVSLGVTNPPETQPSHDDGLVEGKDVQNNELFEKVETPALTTKGIYDIKRESHYGSHVS